MENNTKIINMENNTKITIIIIIITIIFLYCILYYFYKKYKNKYNVPKVEFPFKNLFDENGNKLNVILISAPFREEKHEELYKQYKKDGYYFCGISSYLEFPGKIYNPFEDKFHEQKKHNYIDMVDAWLHCFKDSKNLEILNKIPNILLTEADLRDTEYYKPDETINKEYDFIYVCLDDNEDCSDGWQSFIRNWEMAKKCLKVMCSQFGLKGIIIGRNNCVVTEFCQGKIKFTKLLPYNEFQLEMKKSKFLFVPNISDASPRVITEAIAYNIPVIVNKNIVGGWHNVIENVTGEFFSDENDIIQALTKITTNYDKYKPREWFVNNSGKKIKGKVLADFLKKNFKNLNNKNVSTAYITI
jgi:hypothetical protein